MRIAFFMQGSADDGARPHISAVMEQLFHALSRAGAKVDLLIAESRAWDLARLEPAHDLYVLKSKSPLTLSLAGILRDRGAVIVNGVESCQLARDKIAAEVALARHGLPVPPAWATGQGRLLRPLVKEGALWLKARSGSKGRGVARIVDPQDANLAHNPADAFGLPQPLFAQRDVASPGRDLKVYVVGKEQWAITRPWPALTLEDKLGQPASIDANLGKIAAASGRALGLEIYGVDFLAAGNDRAIIDINAFPGFKGIAEAPQAIAGYLLARANPALALAG